jgi:hypothetical protein
MSKFKPQVTVITTETRRDYSNSYQKGNPYKTLVYPTYRELCKNVKRHLDENLEDNIYVSRSRRGEWGEWYEIWTLVDGKAKIIKEGWQ